MKPVVSGGKTVSRGRIKYVVYSYVTALEENLHNELKGNNKKEEKGRQLYTEKGEAVSKAEAEKYLASKGKTLKDGEVFEFYISLSPNDFEKLGRTLKEQTENFKNGVSEGFDDLWKKLGVKDARAVFGIHLNTKNPHVHVLVNKNVLDLEGNPKSLNTIPLEWRREKNGTTSVIGRIFEKSLEKYVGQVPPQSVPTIYDKAVGMDASKFPQPLDIFNSQKSPQVERILNSLSTDKHISPEWAEHLSNNGSLYVSKRGALVFVRRNIDGVATSFTGEAGWTARDDGKGFFYIGNAKTADRYLLVETPKEALAMLELVGHRDLSRVCIVSMDGTEPPTALTETLKQRSNEQAIRVIWSLGLNRDNRQEQTHFQPLQDAILEAHSGEKQLEFVTYAPRVGFGKTWQQQLINREVPGVLEASIQETKSYFKEEIAAPEERTDDAWQKTIYENLYVRAEENEFSIKTKKTDLEIGRYRINSENVPPEFYLTSASFNFDENKPFGSEEEILSFVGDEWVKHISLQTKSELDSVSEIETSAENEIEDNPVKAAETAQQNAGVSQAASAEAAADANEIGEPKISTKELKFRLHDLPLETVAERLGLSLFRDVDRKENVYRLGKSFKIKIKNEMFCDRYDDNRGGRGVNALIRHILGCSREQATQWLVDNCADLVSTKGNTVYIPKPAPAAEINEEIAEAKELIMPATNRAYLGTVFTYLTRERALNPEIINHVIDKGDLRATTYKSCLFIQRDPDGNITGANWRATKGTARQSVPGTDKKAGWFHLGDLNKASRFIFTESPIEALSYLDLNFDKLNPAHDAVISVDGNSIPYELLEFLAAKGEATEIVLAFNNDDGGARADYSTLEKLNVLTLLRHKEDAVQGTLRRVDFKGTISIDKPAASDWNEDLKLARADEMQEADREHIEADMETSAEETDEIINQALMNDAALVTENDATSEAENAGEISAESQTVETEKPAAQKKRLKPQEVLTEAARESFLKNYTELFNERIFNLRSSETGWNLLNQANLAENFRDGKASGSQLWKLNDELTAGNAIHPQVSASLSVYLNNLCSTPEKAFEAFWNEQDTDTLLTFTTTFSPLSKNDQLAEIAKQVVEAHFKNLASDISEIQNLDDVPTDNIITEIEAEIKALGAQYKVEAAEEYAGDGLNAYSVSSIANDDRFIIFPPDSESQQWTVGIERAIEATSVSPADGYYDDETVFNGTLRECLEHLSKIDANLIESYVSENDAFTVAGDETEVIAAESFFAEETDETRADGINIMDELDRYFEENGYLDFEMERVSAKSAFVSGSVQISFVNDHEGQTELGVITPANDGDRFIFWERDAKDITMGGNYLAHSNLSFDELCEKITGLYHTKVQELDAATDIEQSGAATVEVKEASFEAVSEHIARQFAEELSAGNGFVAARVHAPDFAGNLWKIQAYFTPETEKYGKTEISFEFNPTVNIKTVDAASIEEMPVKPNSTVYLEKMLDDYVASFNKKYPSIGLSVGYIGNIYESENRDERLFSIQTNLKTKGMWRDEQLTNFGSYSTKAKLAQAVVKDNKFENWLSKFDNKNVLNIGEVGEDLAKFVTDFYKNQPDEPAKVTLEKIEVTWSESMEFDTPLEFRNVDDFNKFISETPKPEDRQLYYKTDFTITLSDGDTYQGRFDIGHDQAQTLEEHIAGHRAWAEFLKQQNAGGKQTAWSEMQTEASNAAIDGTTKFLDVLTEGRTYELQTETANAADATAAPTTTVKSADATDYDKLLEILPDVVKPLLEVKTGYVEINSKYIGNNFDIYKRENQIEFRFDITTDDVDGLRNPGDAGFTFTLENGEWKISSAEVLYGLTDEPDRSDCEFDFSSFPQESSRSFNDFWFDFLKDADFKNESRVVETNVEQIAAELVEINGVHDLSGKQFEFELMDFISRETVQNNPDKIFLFGDNLEGTGFGGQAKEMRGEPNAFGIPTKLKPSMDADAFFSDSELESNKAAIDAAFNKLAYVFDKATIIIPSAGLGTGRADLANKAPLTFAYLQEKLASIGYPLDANILQNQPAPNTEKKLTWIVGADQESVTKNMELLKLLPFNDRELEINNPLEEINLFNAGVLSERGATGYSEVHGGEMDAEWSESNIHTLVINEANKEQVTNLLNQFEDVTTDVNFIIDGKEYQLSVLKSSFIETVLAAYNRDAEAELIADEAPEAMTSPLAKLAQNPKFTEIFTVTELKTDEAALIMPEYGDRAENFNIQMIIANPDESVIVYTTKENPKDVIIASRRPEGGFTKTKFGINRSSEWSEWALQHHERIERSAAENKAGKAQLNEKELAAFTSAVQQILDSTGGQFGYLSDAQTPDGMTRQEFAGYCGSLTQKGLINVSDDEFKQLMLTVKGAEEIRARGMFNDRSFETIDGDWSEAVEPRKPSQNLSNREELIYKPATAILNQITEHLRNANWAENVVLKINQSADVQRPEVFLGVEHNGVPKDVATISKTDAGYIYKPAESNSELNALDSETMFTYIKEDIESAKTALAQERAFYLEKRAEQVAEMYSNSAKVLAFFLNQEGRGDIQPEVFVKIVNDSITSRIDIYKLDTVNGERALIGNVTQGTDQYQYLIGEIAGEVYDPEILSREIITAANTLAVEQLIENEFTLPPVDKERYVQRMFERGEGDVLDEENALSPEEVREHFFDEAVAVAARIIELEQIVVAETTTKKAEKDKEKAVKELELKTAGMWSYLYETGAHFGEASEKYLKNVLSSMGFEFDDEYTLLRNDVSTLVEKSNQSQKIQPDLFAAPVETDQTIRITEVSNLTKIGFIPESIWFKLHNDVVEETGRFAEVKISDLGITEDEILNFDVNDDKSFGDLNERIQQLVDENKVTFVDGSDRTFDAADASGSIKHFAVGSKVTLLPDGKPVPFFPDSYNQALKDWETNPLTIKRILPFNKLPLILADENGTEVVQIRFDGVNFVDDANISKDVPEAPHQPAEAAAKASEEKPTERVRATGTYTLLLPEAFDLTASQMQTYDREAGNLKEIGFESIKLGKTVAVKTIPDNISPIEARQLFIELIDHPEIIKEYFTDKDADRPLLGDEITEKVVDAIANNIASNSLQEQNSVESQAPQTSERSGDVSEIDKSPKNKIKFKSSLLPQELLSQIPERQTGELKDRIVYAKFFHPISDYTWFVTEVEEVEEGFGGKRDIILYGYVQGQFGEWGYSSLNEIEAVKVRGLGVERDLYFKQTTFDKAIYDFRRGRGEIEPDEIQELGSVDQPQQTTPDIYTEDNPLEIGDISGNFTQISEKDFEIELAQNLAETDNSLLLREEPAGVKKGTLQLAQQVREMLNRGEAIGNNPAYNKMAEAAFGGTRANGDFDARDAYDALELGVNMHIQDNINRLLKQEPKETLAELNALLKLLPTQSDRTDEQNDFQQFSTPPTESFVAFLATGARASDIAAEPSAGCAGLAIWLKSVCKETHVNEISERRNGILRVIGFDSVNDADAQFLNDTLPQNIKPSVILMNPPFSATGGRTKNNRTIYGAEHVSDALKRLEEGGRLVAIVGEGMGFDKPTFSVWWADIMKKYNVRANITIPGEVYGKYGTTFGNQLLVIDKTGETPGATHAEKMQNVIYDLNVEKIEDVLETVCKLGAERSNVIENENRIDPPNDFDKNDGNILEIDAAEVSKENDTNNGNGNHNPANAVGADQTNNLGDDRGQSAIHSNAAQSDESPARQSTGLPLFDNAFNGSGQNNSGASEIQPGFTFSSDNANGRSPANSGTERGNNFGDSGADSTLESAVVQEIVVEPQIASSIQIGKNVEQGERVSEGVVAYKPAKLSGGVQHPGDIIESASMAAVQPPDITYIPSLDPRIINEGRLSSLQYETVIYAGQQHSRILPDGNRAGYFIGDGTGVGKGRELSGIITDNWNKGVRRVLWLSINFDLVPSTKRDLADLGTNVPIHTLNNYSVHQNLNESVGDGVLFASYATLIGKGKDDAKRFDQIANWLGEDALILLDESHLAKNALQSGMRQSSQRGEAVVDLQIGEKSNPNWRFVYSSATGATEVENMAYMCRLGLWGEGTGFPGGFTEFYNAIDRGGVGAMEMVARDMKACGMYCSRSLSYRGVDYNQVHHELTPEQVEVYNLACKAWQEVVINFDEALRVTGADSKARRYSFGQLWAGEQRFFRQLLTAMKVPSLIQEVERKLEQGSVYTDPATGKEYTLPAKVIVGIIGTGEARTKEQVSRAIELGMSLDEMDFSPKRILLDLVEKCFPVDRYTEKTVGEKTIKIKLVDKEGRPIQSQEALAVKDGLIRDIDDNINLPDNPLDQIVNYFGEAAVAEITGRDKRIIEDKESGERRYVKRAREGVAMDKASQDEMLAFQSNRKLISIISQSASTGISLDADLRPQLKHYVADRLITQQQADEIFNAWKEGKSLDEILRLTDEAGIIVYRDVHITQETSWSADIQMQTFGRSHRTSELVPPEYILMSTNLGGEKRFLATIAKRLSSLGALTKGDRSAAGGGDLLQYDFENKYGDQAARKIVKMLEYGDKEIMQILPPDPFDQTERNGLDLLYRMGIAKYDKDGILAVPEKTKEDLEVSTFLNRVLILDVDTQNTVFDKFTETMESIIYNDKMNGLFDEGVKDIEGENLRFAEEPRIVSEDAATAAKTVYYHIQGDIKTQPLPLSEIGDRNQVIRFGQMRLDIPENKGVFYQQIHSKNIIYVEFATNHTNAATGLIEKRYKQARPSGWLDVLIGENELKEKYRPVRLEDTVEFANENMMKVSDWWNSEVENTPATKVQNYHIIGGAVLPVWQRLNSTNEKGSQVSLKTVRIETQDGERIVGVQIPAMQIARVLRDLGVQQSYKSPAEIFDAVMNLKETITLVGGIKIAATVFNKQPALEIMNLSKYQVEEFQKYGATKEIRSFAARYFVPNEKSKGVEVLAKILERYPAVETGNQNQKSSGKANSPRQTEAAEWLAFGSALRERLVADEEVKAAFLAKTEAHEFISLLEDKLTENIAADDLRRAFPEVIAELGTDERKGNLLSVFVKTTTIEFLEQDKLSSIEVFTDKAKDFTKAIKNGIEKTVDSLKDSSGDLEGSLAKWNNQPDELFEKQIRMLRNMPLSAYLEDIKIEQDERGRIFLNPEAYEFVRYAYQLANVGPQKADGEFVGIFNEPETIDRLLQTFDQLEEKYSNTFNKSGAKNTNPIKEFSKAIKESARLYDGTAIFYTNRRAVVHEDFHQASFLGAQGRNLAERHAMLPELIASPEFQKALPSLIQAHNHENMPLLVEELGADCTEEGKVHNLTQAEKDSYLALWYESYAKANGQPSARVFARLVAGNAKVRHDAYQKAFAESPFGRFTARENRFQNEIQNILYADNQERRGVLLKRDGSAAGDDTPQVWQITASAYTKEVFDGKRDFDLKDSKDLNISDLISHVRENPPSEETELEEIYNNLEAKIRNHHAFAVIDAYNAEEEIPSEVLRDYPQLEKALELKNKYPDKTETPKIATEENIEAANNSEEIAEVKNAAPVSPDLEAGEISVQEDKDENPIDYVAFENRVAEIAEKQETLIIEKADDKTRIEDETIELEIPEPEVIAAEEKPLDLDETLEASNNSDNSYIEELLGEKLELELSIRQAQFEIEKSPKLTYFKEYEIKTASGETEFFSRGELDKQAKTAFAAKDAAKLQEIAGLKELVEAAQERERDEKRELISEKENQINLLNRLIGGQDEKADLTPSLPLDKVTKLQEKAVQRGDADGFGKLEEIVVHNDYYRSNHELGRLQAGQILNRAERDLMVNSVDVKGGDERIPIAIRNNSGKLEVRHLTESQIDDKIEHQQKQITYQNKQTVDSLWRPFEAQLNPFHVANGKLNYLINPLSAFNAHANPIAIFNNNAGVMLTKAVFEITEQQIKAYRARSEKRRLENAKTSAAKNKLGEIENRQNLDAKITDAVDRESINRAARLEEMPLPKFTAKEGNCIEKAANTLRDAELLKVYQETVAKTLPDEEKEFAAGRAAARAIYTKAQAERDALRTIDLKISPGEVTMNASLLETEKAMRSVELAETANNFRLEIDPELNAAPQFTEKEQETLAKWAQEEGGLTGETAAEIKLETEIAEFSSNLNLTDGLPQPGAVELNGQSFAQNNGQSFGNPNNLQTATPANLPQSPNATPLESDMSQYTQQASLTQDEINRPFTTKTEEDLKLEKFTNSLEEDSPLDMISVAEKYPVADEIEDALDLDGAAEAAMEGGGADILVI